MVAGAWADLVAETEAMAAAAVVEAAEKGVEMGMEAGRGWEAEAVRMAVVLLLAAMAAVEVAEETG